MSKIEELYNIAKSFKYEKREDILDALCFLNQPTEDYAAEDYYNLKDLKNKHMHFDAFFNTYKKKSLEQYEEQRLEALKRINAAKDIADSFSIAISEAAEIREGIHGINYNKVFESCCQLKFMSEVCENMLLQGASLTEVSKYVPRSRLGDIYHVATEYFGMKLELSEEEKAEVKRYDEMVESGIKDAVNMWDLLHWPLMKGIPHMQSDGKGWSIDGEEIYDTYTMACIYAECQMAFPYYSEDKANPTYAESFDEVLERIMLSPDKISFIGLEKVYSSQEWNLINRLQEKLLNKEKEG